MNKIDSLKTDRLIENTLVGITDVIIITLILIVKPNIIESGFEQIFKNSGVYGHISFYMLD